MKISRICCLLALPCLVLAQPAAFQSSEVHATAPGTKEGCGFLPLARFECRGATMLSLIAMAYSVNPDQVLGGPDWLASDHFDVVAQAASRQATRASMLPMLQTLLAGRFSLAVHEDRKTMPVYLLKVGPKGPKLLAAAGSNPPECPGVGGEADLIHRMCRDVSMADLSALLPEIARNFVDRPVIDATGLTGRYDFPLDWMNKPVYLAAKANPNGAPAISLSDAIETLGLKLDPGTGPVRTIAVDRVNRTPTQDAVAPPTAFEAAEVRTSKSSTSSLSALPDGQVEILGYTLRALIALALQINGEPVLGGPKWIDSERFDVIAKSAQALSSAALSGMLKSLIVERFHLATHSEQQSVTVFALLAGKDKPKLQPASGTARSECKLALAGKGRSYTCRNTTMSQFVERLPGVAQAYLTHPLIDLTGIQGAWDFSLTWTPKGRLPATPPPTEGVASVPTGDVTLFEAVDKQLGLKLEQRKHPLPVTVIDHADPL